MDKTQSYKMPASVLAALEDHGSGAFLPLDAIPAGELGDVANGLFDAANNAVAGFNKTMRLMGLDVRAKLETYVSKAPKENTDAFDHSRLGA